MARKQKRHRLRSIVILFLLGVCVVLAVSSAPAIDRILYPYPYRDIIESDAAQFGVDPLLVAAVIREESKFISQSESHKGAKGLMQLMPSTAQAIADSLNDKTYSEESLLDPEKNILYGTWYLASLQKVFANDIVLVTAAYNGGRGHVQEWIDSGQIDPDNIRLEDIPFKETRDYVGRVMKSYEKYKKYYG